METNEIVIIDDFNAFEYTPLFTIILDGQDEKCHFSINAAYAG